MRYMRKPLIIDAMQYDGTNFKKLKEFVGENLSMNSGLSGEATLSLLTITDEEIVRKGDYIIKLPNGQFYSCNQYIFKETYDRLSNE